MFTAYFDGSGSPDEGKALAVAGYLSNVDQWSQFDLEWRKCLEDGTFLRFTCETLLIACGSLHLGEMMSHAESDSYSGLLELRSSEFVRVLVTQ